MRDRVETDHRLPSDYRKDPAMRIFDVNFRKRIPNYLFQCGLATASLIVILWVQDVMLRAAIVAAVASSAFVVFVVPDSVAATPRKVVGGHLVGVIVGTVYCSILTIPALATVAEDASLLFDVTAALAVGTSILLMVLTDTEHAPAAGTTLGLVVHEWAWSSVVFILVGVLILSAVRIILRPRLINLL